MEMVVPMRLGTNGSILASIHDGDERRWGDAPTLLCQATRGTAFRRRRRRHLWTLVPSSAARSRHGDEVASIGRESCCRRHERGRRVVPSAQPRALLLWRGWWHQGRRFSAMTNESRIRARSLCHSDRLSSVVSTNIVWLRSRGRDEQPRAFRKGANERLLGIEAERQIIMCKDTGDQCDS